MNILTNETRRLPDFFQSAAGHTLPQCHKQRGRADYLEKMLTSISRVVTEDTYQAKLAGKVNFLQQLDPRIKLAGTLLLILAAALTANLYFLLALQILLIGAAASAGINFKSYFSRVWAPALLFSGVAVLPAIFSWVTPGETLVGIHQGTNLTITKQGLTGAVFVLLRTTASLGMALLLVKTTRWPLLTRALGSLGIPGIFVMVLDLTYRYIFLFLTLLSEYILGRKSRLVAAENSRSRFEWIGSALAGFFRLSLEYSQEVTSAMLARGYTGEVQEVLPLRAKKPDWCFVAIVIIICIGMWGGGLVAKL